MPRLVQVVDQEPEAVGIAEAGGGGEVARHLVAPRRAVGMLGGGQQLDVGEAEVGHVVGEALGQLAVAVVASPSAGAGATSRGAPRRRPSARPRDVRRRGGPSTRRRPTRSSIGRSGWPCRVAPRLAVATGSAFRRNDPSAPRTSYLYLCPAARLGHEDLPHARRAERAHRVDPAVPAVQVAHHPHRPGRGRPHGEGRALHALVHAGMGAEHRPEALVAALAHEMEVELAERRPAGSRARRPSCSPPSSPPQR